MNTALHFSSSTDEHGTPQAFFDAVSDVYGPFDLDVCATPENAKCPRFYTAEQDGLTQGWYGRIWCNPPYGRDIARWTKRAAMATHDTQAVQLVVMLLPARTDTRWWHEWVAPFAQVDFLKGRLRFGGTTNSAPFPSCLAVYRRPLRWPPMPDPWKGDAT